MFDLKRHSLLILMAMVILIMIPMSFASDVDDALAVSDDIDQISDVIIDEELAAADIGDDAVSVDENDDVISENATADDIQTKIDSAEAGGIVDLSDHASYDVKDAVIEVNKALTLQGNGTTTIYGYGGDGSSGMFHVTAKNVVFKDIIFIGTNPNSTYVYVDDETKGANEIKGWAIHFQKASNGLVDNCSFYNFNHGVRIQQQSNDVTVQNSYFTGVTNYLRNDPLVNVEKGTKAIGVMGSQRGTFINNTFEGPVLDAISIASGSGGCSIINNTFIGNSYAIYFGGASTDATTIKGNKFRQVGEFHGVNGTGDAVDWYGLPLISIEKAATGVIISDNEIEVRSGNIFIAAEAGNTAHGGLSELGNLTVTNNTITPVIGAHPSSVTLLHILSRGGDFNPTGDVAVVDNELNGAKPIVYWNTEWGPEDGPIIPSGDLAAAFFVFNSVDNATISLTLLDGDGEPVAAVNIVYSIAGGENKTIPTDEYGEFNITGEAGKTVSIFYDGLTSKVEKQKVVWVQTFKPISMNFTIPAAPEPTPVPVAPIATTLTASNVAVKAGNTATLTITLKDASAKGLSNKRVVVEIDGEPYAMADTDANGVLSVPVKFSSAATKYAYISFIDTTGQYLSSLETVKITVSKKATTMAVKKATLKVKKVKKVKVTLKSEGKALSKKTVTIKVNGKTFKAKTNSKGVASVSVKVAKKGKFTATVKFAGDGAYSAVTKKVKFTVKK